jgi:rhodanese-related sulfurtransferase
MFAMLMGLQAISCHDVSTLPPQRRAAVFDVNARSRWQAAHVPGARHLDPERFTEGDLPADKHGQLVFYCSNFMCRKAPLAARRARAMGYTDVRVMSAGIQGWLKDGLPVQAAD